MSAQNSKRAQYVVVGGSGQTGFRLAQLLAKRGDRVLCTSRGVDSGLPAGPLGAALSPMAKSLDTVTWRPLDMNLPGELFTAQLVALDSVLDISRPIQLVMAAAYTNVEGCEEDPALCARVNVQNTCAVFDWALKRPGSKVVFYSTDYVFDGQAGPYREDDRVCPINVYGRAKVEVEQWLAERATGSSLILRTTGVFDQLPGSKNFMTQLVQSLREGKEARVASDQMGNPVWALDLAIGTLKLLDLDKSGVYHIAGDAFLFRTDWARQIAASFGIEAPKIIPVETSVLGQKAKRPLKGGLVMDKLKRELDWAPHSGEQALELMQKLFNGGNFP